MIMAFCSQAIVLNLVEHDKNEKRRKKIQHRSMFSERTTFSLFLVPNDSQLSVKSTFVNSFNTRRLRMPACLFIFIHLCGPITVV